MARTNYTTGQCGMRLRFCFTSDFVGHAISAPICGGYLSGVGKVATPGIGMAQGRSVSISRGSPPPKKR